MQQGRLFTWLSFGSAQPSKVAQFSVGANTQSAGVALVASEIPPDASVCGNARRLKQVLLNLLSNAIKYNRRNGSVKVAVSPCDEGQTAGWELTVADSGVGLTNDQIGRLFQPFERLGAERSAIKGTGIGLTLARRLTELMDGTLTVKSRAGHGSTFSLRLPRVDLDARNRLGPHPVGTQPRAADSGTVDSRHRVLYVEDNEANQRLLEGLLVRREDIELRVVATASEAAALAIAWQPSLLLIDIQLPDGDGHQLLRDLREQGVAAPALAVSANAMPSDLKRGRESGFADYLTKPLDLWQALTAIDAHLGSPGDGLDLMDDPNLRSA